MLAALSAEGESIVDNIRYIQRGYEDFDIKLRSLGADIRVIDRDTDYKDFKLLTG